LASLNNHSGAIKSVAWISSETDSQTSQRVHTFLSASHDQSIIKWKWNETTRQIIDHVKCIGHSQSVETVDVNNKFINSNDNHQNLKFISGSWDKMLKLWTCSDDDQVINNDIDIDDNDIDADEPLKKIKKKKDSIKQKVKTPIITLSGHTENISCCKWMSENTACTGSWDHSIRLWDLYEAQETRCIRSGANKIFVSIDYSVNNQLIAAALNDNLIRLYDPRSNEGSVIKSTLSSHTTWCSSVFWSINNENLLISGSYDSLAKLWDIRK
jgi:ribosome biogenesis protein